MGDTLKILQVIGGVRDDLTKLLATQEWNGDNEDLLVDTFTGIVGAAARQVNNLQAIGMRVKVMSGDGKVDYGLGTLVDFVTVYIGRREGTDGIVSRRMAEEKFEGAIEAGGNPKIQLDNGQVVYGCQVWWEPAEEQEVSGAKANDQTAPAGAEGAGPAKDPDLTPETTSC